ncbi:hypothetical protein WN71_023900 [Streptomyces mangrovisoli]|uniref:Uncharacterized protein n=1 Tax=Streptomyces mangrovisoli TaxID=1428628 RepID=A0A1J4NSW5_9ACTN|nr:hypothetical protein WN71_023900 [Streptomyces mangrovisoli]
MGPDDRARPGFVGVLQESVQRSTARSRFVVLTQVVAHPHAQQRDIARRLQQRLLTELDAPLGVALFHPADSAGQAAFASWGWQNMGEFVGLPGAVAPCVLILPREGVPSAVR